MDDFLKSNHKSLQIRIHRPIGESSSCGRKVAVKEVLAWRKVVVKVVFAEEITMGSLGRTCYLVVLFLTAVAVTGTVVFLAGGANFSGGGGTCTLSMFGNRSGAFWACRVQAALQQNWFPDPIQVWLAGGGGDVESGFVSPNVALEKPRESKLSQTKFVKP